MLPGILNQLGAESLSNLKKLATTVTSGGMCLKHILHIILLYHVLAVSTYYLHIFCQTQSVLLNLLSLNFVSCFCHTYIEKLFLTNKSVANTWYNLIVLNIMIAAHYVR